ncbi:MULTISPECIES: TOBE domain-containing protein [unclassified Pseudomonas]|uniref:TOBE domain-containing protein n=1 Tax=unclassified Pseudomonas TaxID=196821 RepID=UPI00244D33DF|nr:MULTISPECIES: TOBE domain-containing protein [unclassified Pseudomonas]MDG9922970.1 TOBE domain-containing protein [Pseudomonas sp. GD04045]MDH0035666.1 TOBE domain-containing protein [Pseudomonas sp. GD04019]
MEKDNAIQLHGSLWMTVAGENFGGRGRVALLARVAECGSITQAAKSLGMSYKAAWDAIDTMNNLAGEPLVQRLVGGKGGGGTHLTTRGQRLVDNFRLIEREHQRFVTQLGGQAEGMADDYLLVRRMGMKSSARNQFLGTVSGLKIGAINDEVELSVAGGARIVAVITHDSTQALGLDLGSEVFALIKSSSIVLVADGEGARFSARNQLPGSVVRLQPGAVNTEVVIALPEGPTLAAIITNDSARSLDLRQGQAITAIFKASSVILGVPA